MLWSRLRLWLGNSPSNSRSQTRHRAPSFRPRMETLEDRVVPSTDFIVQTLGDTNLTVSGNAGDAVRNAQTLRGALAAAVSGDTITFKANLSGAIDLNGNEGGSGSSLTVAANVTINGTGANITVEGGATPPSITDVNYTNPNQNVQVFVINSGVTATISHLSIINGYAPASNPAGGGIDNNGNLTLTFDVISANKAGQGGGIFDHGGSPSTLTMSHCSVLNNISDSNGGGIYVGNGDTAIIDTTTISGNSTQFIGGGIANQTGTLTITNSTISFNRAVDLNLSGTNVGFGGGIGMFGQSTTLTNCTIANNSAGFSSRQGETTFGGGGLAVGSGTLSMTNCTVAFNQSTDTQAVSGQNGGGGILNFFNLCTINLLNTLVASNTASNSIGPDISGNAKANFSLIQNISGWTPVGGSGNNVTGLNPGLATTQPANNGGTNLDGQGLPLFTIALSTGSPAIQKGRLAGAPTTDERGVARKNPPDIGAYEVAAASTPGRRRGPF
jgi:hypothetical protein